MRNFQKINSNMICVGRMSRDKANQGRAIKKLPTVPGARGVLDVGCHLLLCPVTIALASRAQASLHPGLTSPLCLPCHQDLSFATHWASGSLSGGKPRTGEVFHPHHPHHTTHTTKHSVIVLIWVSPQSLMCGRLGHQSVVLLGGDGTFRR